MGVKLPLYNVLNVLLTGFVFMGGCGFLFSEKALQVLHNTLILKIGTGPEIVLVSCIFALAYESGLIINRIGAVIVEKLLKSFGWIPFDDDYAKFNECRKRYLIMEVLSREYALSRTSMTLFLVLSILSFCTCQCVLGIAFLGVVGVYFASCKKHAEKIVTLMHSGENHESGN